MLIRSQNKKVLVNLDTVLNLYIEDYFEKFRIYAKYPYMEEYNVLGSYSAEAKALKVLDIIQEAYINSSSTLNEALMNDNYWLNIKNRNYVFEMPQEEDIN